MPRWTAALAGAGLLLLAPPAALAAQGCRAPERRTPLPPELPGQPTVTATATSTAPAAAGDYRERLRPTAWGWVHLRRWCVWLEPAARGDDAEAQRQRLWLAAMEAALELWATDVTVERTDDPAAAQVRVHRRRPPLRRGADGRPRASHGRAQLALVLADGGGRRWIEPQVEVWIGPGQGPRGLQATALHELGHAFGLWGHSPDPADAMAAIPGARPVLTPSARDRATLRWLQVQPTRIGVPLEAADAVPATGPASRQKSR